MCGIIGINSKRDCIASLLSGLHRLEYRGYDSAGLSFINNAGLHTIKVSGKVQDLENALAIRNNIPKGEGSVHGTVGIAHTRWATHGRPCEKNAHPHSNGTVSVIHNGIVENYLALKEGLTASGIKCISDTDSEVITHLITIYLNQGCSNIEAIRKTANQLTGHFSILAIFLNDPEVMIATKRHSSICIGQESDGTFVGSDSYALSKFVDSVCYLEDSDIAVCKKDGFLIFDLHDLPAHRETFLVKESDRSYSKGLFVHYMQKEIFEQPLSSRNTLKHYIEDGEFAKQLKDLDLSAIKRIYIVACGSSLFAGMTAKHWLQELAIIPVEVEISSEFCYRVLQPEENSLGIFLSQSGETADTITALRFFKGTKRISVGIVNNSDSTIGRETNICLPLYAGPEVSVATTKAFTSQLIVLACLTLKLASDRKLLQIETLQAYIAKLMELPGRISALLDRDQEFKDLATTIAHRRNVLYLGRGISYAIALEGALKLKELSYIHAEAIAAGELKHGSIALVDEDMYAIVIAPQDKLFLKTMSNVQTVTARHGNIIFLSSEWGCTFARSVCKNTVVVSHEEDESCRFIIPILYTIPLQLVAYHSAVLCGHNVDQPRNLAKSVTVE
jgi:glucosamine--fructose-6-phosphate aminotransferase (isomerizing)